MPSKSDAPASSSATSPRRSPTWPSSAQPGTSTAHSGNETLKPQTEIIRASSFVRMAHRAPCAPFANACLQWIHQATLAICAQIPIDTLLDQVALFPTYSEAYLGAGTASP